MKLKNPLFVFVLLFISVCAQAYSPQTFNLTCVATQIHETEAASILGLDKRQPFHVRIYPAVTYDDPKDVEGYKSAEITGLAVSNDSKGTLDTNGVTGPDSDNFEFWIHFPMDQQTNSLLSVEFNAIHTQAQVFFKDGNSTTQRLYVTDLKCN